MTSAHSNCKLRFEHWQKSVATSRKGLSSHFLWCLTIFHLQYFSSKLTKASFAKSKALGLVLINVLPAIQAGPLVVVEVGTFDSEVHGEKYTSSARFGKANSLHMTIPSPDCSAEFIVQTMFRTSKSHSYWSTPKHKMKPQNMIFSEISRPPGFLFHIFSSYIFLSSRGLSRLWVAFGWPMQSLHMQHWTWHRLQGREVWKGFRMEWLELDWPQDVVKCCEGSLFFSICHLFFVGRGEGCDCANAKTSRKTNGT